MSDTWKFTWIGPGITNTINNKSIPNVGDASLSKKGNIVTLIPETMSSIYSIPAWEFNLKSSPNKPFTTSSSVNNVQNGRYTPDQNYFFPVDLHTLDDGVRSDFFYLFLKKRNYRSIRSRDISESGGNIVCFRCFIFIFYIHFSNAL